MLAVAGLIYFVRARRNSLGEALHQLAEAPRRIEGPEGRPSALDRLKRADEQLTEAIRILEEVYSIGVWTKADDCSDNRRRRKRLRDADWVVTDAYQALKEAEPKWPEGQASVAALAQDVDAVVKVLESLPDTIPDTMADNNLELDCTLRSLTDQLEALRERSRALAAVWVSKP